MEWPVKELEMRIDYRFFKLHKEIVANQIMTTLDEAFCTEENTKAKKVRRKLRKKNYTMAPVTVNGVIKKFVKKSDLKDEGYVSDYSLEIDKNRLISHETKVLDLIYYFVYQSVNDRFYFLLKGNEIVGFVLPADLNKYPVYILFYTIFSKLEIELKRIIQKCFRHNSGWLSLLWKNERNAVSGLYEKLRNNDMEISKLECTQLKHLLRIVGKDRQLLGTCGYSSKTEFEKVTTELVDFRHSIMHPVRKLVIPPKKLENLKEITELALQLIDRVRAPKTTKDAFKIWNEEDGEGVRMAINDNLLRNESPMARLFDKK